MTSAEQQARDILERMCIKDAQSFSSGKLVEIANIIAERNSLTLSRLDEECLRIGQQMQRAAGTLPAMCHIDVENGGGGVKLFNDNGDEFYFGTDSEGLSYSIETAIDTAIGKQAENE
jgi:hypothetical protein